MYSVIRRKRNYTIRFGHSAFDGTGGAGAGGFEGFNGFRRFFREMETAATESIILPETAPIWMIFSGICSEICSTEPAAAAFRANVFYSGGPGGSFRGRGRDLNTEVTVTFDEAAFGCDKLLNFRREGRQCPDSAGSYSCRH